MKLSELIEKYGDCEVKEELVDMIKPKGEWKPKKGENYWFMLSNGHIFDEVWNEYNEDLFRLAKRNCYQTKEEAQFALDMYNFCKERSFEPDWENSDQDKFGLHLNHAPRQKGYWKYLDVHNFLPFYYPSKEAVNEVINKYSFDELAKYYGRV